MNHQHPDQQQHPDEHEAAPKLLDHQPHKAQRRPHSPGRSPSQVFATVL
jgi:hypothetical protein